MRTTASILIGYVVWTVLWLVGNGGLASTGIVSREPDVRIEAPGALVAMLLLSVAASVASGILTRAVAPTGAGPSILALLLLATGVGVQWSYRSQMPVWYHLSFLALLVPATLLGARLKSRKATSA